MTSGICTLSIVPLQGVNQHNAPVLSEVLYGEIFQILKVKKHFSQVCLSDKTTGWIENSQFIEISTADFEKLSKQTPKISANLVEFIYKDAQILFPIPIGSIVQHTAFLGHQFEGKTSGSKPEKNNIRTMAFMFVNTPFRKGGKSPFGMDADGFVQTVYALCGFALPRTAVEQAEKGIVLSFIEEAEIGDLAFFDDDEGNIVHVGIILEHNHIIHAHGQVRVDRLDQTGIFNPELRTHTHKLRLIKSIA
ncbi:MAG: NlpC/P60 family protein [Bacteroidetes bacterium]|nr:NlpC/P60 family protein [Bacteroidota bacterium]MDA0887989.1 NlpC/P60 family protein [Bacteroidota bacterium]MDA1083943.1 NlpC/P60 family protein [Bacteroidota bacterium]